MSQTAPSQPQTQPASAGPTQSPLLIFEHIPKTAGMQPPIFILGPNRSGTTLVRLLINAHSQVCVPDELIFWDERVFHLGLRRWQRTSVPMQVLNRFVGHLAKRLPGVTEAKTWAAIDGCGSRDPCSIYVAVMEMLTGMAGKSRWGEKTPGNLFFADVLLEMFPEARFIFVQRDPRAVVASMNKVPFYSADTTLNVMNLKHFLSWMQRAERVIPAEKQHHVRYETLLAEPEKAVQAMCDFLAIDYEPAMLEFHRDAADAMQPTAIADFNRRATGPLDPLNADRWRDSTSPHDQAIVEQILGSEMQHAGYEHGTSLPELRLVDRLVLEAKTTYWRVNRLRRWRQRCFQQRDVVLYRTPRRIAGLARRVGLSVSMPTRRGTATKRELSSAKDSQTVQAG